MPETSSLEYKKRPPVFLRVVFLALSLLALQQAWVGVQWHRGNLALEERKFREAYRHFEKGRFWNITLPSLDFDMGLSAYEAGVQPGAEDAAVWFKKAIPLFEA